MTTSIQSVRELCLTLACDVHASGNGQGSVVNTAKAFEAYLTGDTAKLVKDGVGGESRPIEYLVVPKIGDRLNPDIPPIGPIREFYSGAGDVEIEWDADAPTVTGDDIAQWSIYRRDPQEMPEVSQGFCYIGNTALNRFTDSPDVIASDPARVAFPVKA